MKITKGLLYLFFPFVFLSSCEPTKPVDDNLKNIPSDLSLVTAFNMGQLLQKVDLAYIQSLDVYKSKIEKLKKQQAVLAAVIEQPNYAGVDLTKNMYFVLDVNPDYPTEQFYGFVFSIADQGLFERMLSKFSVDDFQNRDQFKCIINQNKFLVWNESLGFIGNGNRSIDIDKEMARFFGPKGEQSVANQTDLKKCLSANYDVKTWINTDFLAKNENLKKTASLIGISNEALQGNYIHSYFNFNDGDIMATSNHFLQRELTNDLNLFLKDEIDENLSKYIPADNLEILVGGAFDTKGIYQVLSEKVGAYAMLNKQLKKYGFSAKNISKAFGGNALVARYKALDGKETAETLIVSNIDHHKTFNKFIDLAKQFDILEKQTENFYLIKDKELNQAIRNSKEVSYLLIKNDLFFISTNESRLQKINAGGYHSADQVDASIYQNIVSNSIGAYIDLKTYKDLSIGIEKGQEAFNNISFNATLESAYLKMEMQDKNMNSLQALFKLMNEIYLSEKKVLNSTSI